MSEEDELSAYLDILHRIPPVGDQEAHLRLVVADAIQEHG
jgi:hypothetical protein